MGHRPRSKALISTKKTDRDVIKSYTAFPPSALRIASIGTNGLRVSLNR